MSKFRLMKQNRMGTACIMSSNDKESLEMEKRKREKAQSHVPHHLQLYYYIHVNYYTRHNLG